MLINEHESYEVKEHGEFVDYLDARYDSRASFYKKAKIIKYNGALW